MSIIDLRHGMLRRAVQICQQELEADYRVKSYTCLAFDHVVMGEKVQVQVRLTKHYTDAIHAKPLASWRFEPRHQERFRQMYGHKNSSLYAAMRLSLEDLYANRRVPHSARRVGVVKASTRFASLMVIATRNKEGFLQWDTSKPLSECQESGGKFDTQQSSLFPNKNPTSSTMTIESLFDRVSEDVKAQYLKWEQMMFRSTDTKIKMLLSLVALETQSLALTERQDQNARLLFEYLRISGFDYEAFQYTEGGRTDVD